MANILIMMKCSELFSLATCMLGMEMFIPISLIVYDAKVDSPLYSTCIIVVHYDFGVDRCSLALIEQNIIEC